MTKFLKHEPCPKCGSRNNLGRYSDNSAWCFGCHYYERSDTSPFIKERDGTIEEQDVGERVCLPEDSTFELGSPAIQWLSIYGITPVEALRAGFKWSRGWEQLLIPFYNNAGQVCCIQAKNFNIERAKKAKYYNVGNKNEHFTVYGKGTTLVFTEDALSSLKIGRQSAAMPLLGTSVAKSKIMALRGSYDKLIVWLDADKWTEAKDIAESAKFLGLSTQVVYSDKDPKEYSDQEIKEILHA